jgi:hypothetical protein
LCGTATLGALALFSCSAVRQIQPLEKGESAINVTLGGPVTEYIGDASAPLPLLGIGYNYGLLNKLDIEAGIGVTQLLYRVLQLDAGVNFRPWTALRWRPQLILSPRFQFTLGPMDFSTDLSARLYPALLLTVSWNAGPTLHPYIGIENWWDLQSERDDGAAQENHWLIAPYAGLSFCHKRWQFGAEFRVYTPNLPNTGRAPDNTGFGDYGIIGAFIGVGRTFGGPPQQAP